MVPACRCARAGRRFDRPRRDLQRGTTQGPHGLHQVAHDGRRILVIVTERRFEHGLAEVDLWATDASPPDWLAEVWGELGKTVILVTHDVEEAVVLSDRIVVLRDRPATVERSVDLDLPRPRLRDTEPVVRTKSDILSGLLAGGR